MGRALNFIEDVHRIAQQEEIGTVDDIDHYASGCFVLRVSSSRRLGEMLSLVSKLLKQHMLENDAAVSRQGRPKDNPVAAVRISPQQLRDALVDVFPEFEQYWEDEDNPQLEAGEFTHHGLMLEFISFFGKGLSGFSERQLKRLATVVNDAASQPGPAESAVSTCFLEHLHQIHADKALRPFLSHEAKSRSNV